MTDCLLVVVKSRWRRRRSCGVAVGTCSTIPSSL